VDIDRRAQDDEKRVFTNRWQADTGIDWRERIGYEKCKAGELAAVQGEYDEAWESE